MFREFAAARLRAEDDYRRDVTLAWNTVRVYAMAKAKKRLPKLSDLLGEVGRPERQTHGQMRAALSVLSQQYGIPLRKVQVH